MQSINNKISDSTILALIRENNLSGWEQLYDKYGPVMYGIISTHTSDKTLAEEILIKLFLRLKQKEFILKLSFSLCVYLVRYTYINTKEELKIRGINSSETPIRANSILETLCSQSITTKQVAANLKISEQQVIQNLHKEFLSLRSQPSQTITTVKAYSEGEHRAISL